MECRVCGQPIAEHSKEQIRDCLDLAWNRPVGYKFKQGKRESVFNCQKCSKPLVHINGNIYKCVHCIKYWVCCGLANLAHDAGDGSVLLYKQTNKPYVI